MKPPARRAWGGAALAVLALALVGPAIGQQAPESLLPPGFNTPPEPQAPPPTATPAASAAPTAPLAGEAPTPQAAVELPLDGPDNATEAELPPGPEELPDAARRPLDQVGVDAGYGPAAFGDVDGRYIATLMRRVSTPIASRWAEITLRRTLLAATPAPRGEGQADWVADRAALLLRLGEADAARTLVQGVDVDRFSPRLRRVAMQTALATSDPAALCPLADGSETIGEQPVWPMVRAMCASLSGDLATAAASIGRAPPNDPIDHALAEKVVAGGGTARRVVRIDWTAVDALTDWRYGLATALNIVIPQPLVDAAPAWFQAWLARAPMLAAADRVVPARFAATLGPVSSAELVDLYGRVMDEAGDSDSQTPGGRLRAAYLGDDDGQRIAAMRALWDTKAPGAATDGTPGERDRYASWILTARAAARIAPSDDHDDDLPALIASMLSAGLDVQADRWAAAAQAAGGTAGDRAWSLLAVASPRRAVPADAARLRAIAKRAGEDGRQRTGLLLAALAGLGRLPAADAVAIAQDNQVSLGGQTDYGRALDRAVVANQPGTVVMLAATGLQTPTWAGVAPRDFYRMIAALRAVGLDGEARMIAAEALSRL